MITDQRTLPRSFLVLGMLTALAAAFLLQDSGSLSVLPPGGTQPDAIGKEFWLHLSAYTAWVTTLLLIPAMYFIWFADRQAHWIAYWEASWVAYIIHLGVSMFGFFGGDFAWMTSSTRVSAFWPGMILAVWWGIDMILGPREGRIIWYQRVAVHLLAFILFFGGSAIKGELTTIRVIGAVLALATVVAAFQYILRRGEERAR